MNREDFIKFEKNNANIFNILTALFCQPDDKVVLNTDIFSKLDKSLRVVCGKDLSFYKEFRDAINKYTQIELLVEYSRLFFGPFKILVHPYSCMYFGGKSLMSSETLLVINFYKKMGLSFDESIKDAPDHVAIETEFMYYLIFNGLKFLEKNDDKKAIFFFEGQNEFFLIITGNGFRNFVPAL